MRRFPRLRLQTIGLILLCLGFAIPGAWIADYWLRQEDSRRRNSLVREPMTMEQSFAKIAPMNMKPSLMRTLAIPAGSPLFSSFRPMDFKLPWKIRDFPVGSRAPDFSLPDALDQHLIHLADFRNKKPVVLLFGSFGCDIFCSHLARLNKLYQAYKDRVEFLFVYITEAQHHELPPSGKAEKKLENVHRGLRHFQISFPCLLGNKEIEEAYTPYPLRLMVVDRAGRIAMDAGVGLPRGWDLDGIECWLKKSGLIPADVPEGTTADKEFPLSKMRTASILPFPVSLSQGLVSAQCLRRCSTACAIRCRWQ